uniref:Altered inheritance of mitochondria protein 24, mitochondrial n=1 Tax=Haptolina ericina TaxID=156174 RepID=A0A7S3ATE6_9EUKA
MQVLHLKLSPQEKIITEPGLMLYEQAAITNSVNCYNCCGRFLSCNPIVMASFFNKNEEGGEDQHVGLTPSIPAKILPLEVGTANGGKWYKCRKGSHMGSRGSAALGFNIDCNPLTACCGGHGCCRQTMTGAEEGTGFLQVMGTVVTKTLPAGETIVIDTNSLVAWENTASLGVKLTGCPCMCLCGGEGLCNTTITGPGEVYIQSMSWEKFFNAMKIVVKKQDDGSVEIGQPEQEEMDR